MRDREEATAAGWDNRKTCRPPAADARRRWQRAFLLSPVGRSAAWPEAAGMAFAPVRSKSASLRLTNGNSWVSRPQHRFPATRCNRNKQAVLAGCGQGVQGLLGTGVGLNTETAERTDLIP
jgi:hypothetical protein